MIKLFVLSLLTLFVVINAQNQGTILAPASGAKIKPNQKFSFGYKQHQDYCVSSHNITVALLTQPPTSVTNTGHYFGRYATGSYPAQGLPNPNPPVPDKLKMPDFSLQPGGFGTGLAASDVPIWITVIEEWNTCQVSIIPVWQRSENSSNATAYYRQQLVRRHGPGGV